MVLITPAWKSAQKWFFLYTISKLPI